MNKINKLAFGLAVAAVAFGFSAFKMESKRDSAIYYQTVSGTYVKAEPNGECETTSLNPCAYFFATDPEISSFPSNNVPTGGVATPDGNRIYTEPAK